ncbi:MAG: hypothetical protein ACYDER_25860 [Ktedonobacteraceae bacterium]
MIKGLLDGRLANIDDREPLTVLGMEFLRAGCLARRGEDLLRTAIEFIAILLVWYPAPLQLAFEQVVKPPEEPLTIGLGHVLPLTDCLPDIGRGGAVLGEGLDMGHRLPHALRLGPSICAQLMRATAAVH